MKVLLTMLQLVDQLPTIIIFEFLKKKIVYMKYLYIYMYREREREREREIQSYLHVHLNEYLIAFADDHI